MGEACKPRETYRMDPPAQGREKNLFGLSLQGLSQGPCVRAGGSSPPLTRPGRIQLQPQPRARGTRAPNAVYWECGSDFTPKALSSKPPVSRSRVTCGSKRGPRITYDTQLPDFYTLSGACGQEVSP